MTFSPGDKVKCTDYADICRGPDPIVGDKVYEIESFERGYVTLRGDNGRQWNSCRFRLVNHIPDSPMPTIESVVLKAFKEAMA